MKTKKKKRIISEPASIARVIWTSQCLEEGDQLRAQVVKRLRSELFAVQGDLSKLSKRWRVSLRQVQRTLRVYRESGELADKETLGQQLKRSLAAQLAKARQS